VRLWNSGHQLSIDTPDCLSSFFLNLTPSLLVSSDNVMYNLGIDRIMKL
jgi:hypothetical protein